MDRDALLELIPAYALDALSAQDRAQVEALLRIDDEAQQHLADYQTVTETLLFTASYRAAPAHLGDDLRSRLTVRNAASANTPQFAVDDDSDSADDTPPNPSEHTLFQWRGWMTAAAALLVVVMGLIFWQLANPGPITGERLYTQLDRRANVTRIPLNPGLSDDISGELLISSNEKQAVIRVYGLPDIDPTQGLQLWMVAGEDRFDGGVFQFDNPHYNNYMIVPIDRPASEYRVFGVTLEPAEGSPLGLTPTGPRVFNVSLQQEQ